MPYPNEHAGRVKDPGNFVESSFRRKSIKGGISIVLGKLKSDPQGSMVVQAYRFAKEKFTAEQAKEWLKEHDVKTILFEAAKKEDSMDEVDDDEIISYNAGIDGNISDIIADSEFFSNTMQVPAGGTSMGLKKQPRLSPTSPEMEATFTPVQNKAKTCKCDTCGGEGTIKIKDGGEKRCNSCKGSGVIKVENKKDSAGMENLLHFDQTFFTSSWMVRNFERTTDGFLQGRAVVTNVGVFEYKDAGGVVRRELRLPEEVFDRASLNSLKLKPMTNNHPKGLVNPKNAKALQVGMTGDNPSTDYGPFGSMDPYNPRNAVSDGYRVAIDLVITDEETINDVLEGKRALSCGYNCDLEKAEEGAKWMGMPYDFIQRDIRYNHVAIVDAARAGDDAIIRLDSADSTALVKINSPKEDSMMKSIKLDGVEYQAEADVIRHLNQTTEKADKFEKELAQLRADSTKVEAERDTLKDKVSTLGKDNTELKANRLDAVAIKAAISSRMKIVEAGKTAGVEVKEDMDDAMAKKAIIMKVFPSAVLEGKSDDYITARFDGAVESLAEKADALNRQKVNGSNLPGNNDGSTSNQDNLDAKAKRDEMIKRMREDSRKKIEVK